MKHIITLLLVLASICCAKQFTVKVGNLSSHRGDVWTIRSFGSVDNGKIAHGHLNTNSMTIKWNIKKGRMKVICDDLCNENDEFVIKLFDKDSLRIDFIAYDIKPNQYRSGDEYIVPSDIQKDIAYMEIMSLNNDWEPDYEVVCYDGYMPYIPPDVQNDLREIPTGFTYNLIYLAAVRCVKQSSVQNVKQSSVQNVKESSLRNDCPPSWKDSKGLCDPRWYSDISN